MLTKDSLWNIFRKHCISPNNGNWLPLPPAEFEDVVADILALEECPSPELPRQTPNGQWLESDREPGADTGTKVEHKPDCVALLDDESDYQHLDDAGTCTCKPAAERGTTPPEGLRELVEKSLETQARMNEHANALHDYFAHSTETTEPFDWIEYHRKRVNDLRVPATQRAPVTMRNCGICGKPFRDDDGKGFCICVLD